MTDQKATPEASEPTAEAKSMGQTYYEEAEVLRASGISNADAVRQVAEQHGKSIGSIRGGIYQHRMRLENGGTVGATGRSRRSMASVDDCLGQARVSLERALEMIDGEVEAARISFESAKERYELVQASVKDRKADIERKLKALA